MRLPKREGKYGYGVAPAALERVVQPFRLSPFLKGEPRALGRLEVRKSRGDWYFSTATGKVFARSFLSFCGRP